MPKVKHTQPTNASLVLSTVEGWSVATVNNEPCIRDIDLAERLEFGRSVDIRKIIRRHAHNRNLNDSEIFAIVAQNKDPRGRGRPATEFWLSEAAALFIVTKSETPNAIALTKEMIRVFTLARRGALPQQPDTTAIAMIAAMQEQFTAALVKLQDEVVAMRSEQARAQFNSGILGYDLAERYNIRIKWIADCWVRQGRARNRRSANASIRQNLIAATGYGGTGRRLAFMPIALRGELDAALTVMERDVSRVENVKALPAKKPVQSSMPWDVN